MLPTHIAKAALPVALLSLALTAFAQGTSSGTSSGSTGSASSGSSSGSGSMGSGSSKAGASKSDSSKSGSSKSGSSKGGQLDHSDRKFLETAAKDGLAEVELGQLASQRAESPEVKQFGQRMVQDHGKANDQLKQLAQSKGVDVPTETDKSHQKKMEKLQKLSGAQFDKQYMDDMVKDHKKDVKEFQKQAKSAKDPDVKAFASQTAPVLQEHLQMAEAAQKTAKGESKSSKGSSKGSTASGKSGSGSSSMSGSAGTTPGSSAGTSSSK
jgi:putative membrane protein